MLLKRYERIIALFFRLRLFLNTMVAFVAVIKVNFNNLKKYIWKQLKDLIITFLSPPPGLYLMLSNDPILERMFLRFGLGAKPTGALMGGSSVK